MGCLIVAEAGVNHNGSLELALDLVDAAAAAGADAVKFQTFRTEALVRSGTATAGYQAATTGEIDQASLLKGLELPRGWHVELRNRARRHGVLFLSTPFDIESAEFLIGLGMEQLKVGSGDLTNTPFMETLASLGLPMIVSTGMAYMDEVRTAVEAVRRGRAGAPDALTLLHCTSAYPARVADANLRAIGTMRKEMSLPIGYSDHTEGLEVPIAAVALGATVLEKHFTLDRGLPGPDHRASLEPDQMAELVRRVRAVERALGDGEKVPRPDEIPLRHLVRRSVTLTRPVSAGHRLRPEDLTLLRPADGIPPADLPRLIGRTVRSAMPAGTPVRWDDIEAS